MKSKSLDKSVTDYVKSLEKVLEKRKMWNESTQTILKESLSKIILTYDIGWKVQEKDIELMPVLGTKIYVNLFVNLKDS